MVRITLSNAREKSNVLIYPGLSLRSTASVSLIVILFRMCKQQMLPATLKFMIRLVRKYVKTNRTEQAEG